MNIFSYNIFNLEIHCLFYYPILIVIDFFSDLCVFTSFHVYIRDYIYLYMYLEYLFWQICLSLIILYSRCWYLHMYFTFFHVFFAILIHCFHSYIHFIFYSTCFFLRNVLWTKANFSWFHVLIYCCVYYIRLYTNSWYIFSIN